MSSGSGRALNSAPAQNCPTTQRNDQISREGVGLVKGIPLVSGKSVSRIPWQCHGRAKRHHLCPQSLTPPSVPSSGAAGWRIQTARFGFLSLIFFLRCLNSHMANGSTVEINRSLPLEFYGARISPALSKIFLPRAERVYQK